MEEMNAALDAVIEPPCEACIRAGGLCHMERCRRRILPELKEPSWPKLIGEGYTCDGKTCGQGEHLVCLESPEFHAPRSGCQCHSCGQRRSANKHERKVAKDPAKKRQASVQLARISRREQRKSVRAAQRRGISGLAHSLKGGKSPRGPMRSVA